MIFQHIKVPVFALLCLVAAISLLNTFQITTASALSGSEYRPGRIIDDAVFYNSQSMSANQIQQFLNSKVPNCDYNGTQSASDWGYPNMTHAQIAENKRNGTNGFSRDTGFHAPPYKCLTMYTQTTPQMEAASGYCNAINAGTRTAAQIIDDVSKACGINPQVLLVLLEKEQSLVTDNWPLNRQHRNATGFACPDTAPCDPAYEGFFYQVYHAARQFKVYRAFPNNYNYVAGRTNRIYWQTNLGNFINPTGNADDPSRAGQALCGHTNVYIENQATAALYIYTPYQPNQKALANLRGSGDACSAYGNRNFWRLFSDWFGNTITLKSDAYISNGVYRIYNQSSNKSIDIANGSTNDGAQIQAYEANNSTVQQWRIVKDDEGYYTITNPSTNKSLDVVNGDTSAGSRIQLWSSNTSCAQKWAAVSMGSGYQFVNKCSGRALDIINGQSSNGTPLQIWDRNSTTAQIWGLAALDPAPIANGFYIINTTAWIPLTGVGGTNVTIQNATSGSSQYWQVVRQQDGTYKLRNPQSNKYLDVIGADTAAGTNLQIWNGNESCAQKWILTSNGYSTHSLQSSCSGLALDVTNNYTSTSGTKVQMWANNNTDAQRWIFSQTPINFIPDSTYSLRTVTGMALDISGGNSQSGTKIQIWDRNYTSSQSWDVIKQQDGTYKLRNPQSNKYLDVIGASTAAGTNVQIWDGNDECAQKWTIINNNDSTYSIQSSCSTNALDITGGQLNSAGTKIQIYIKNNTVAQKWTFDAP